MLSGTLSRYRPGIVNVQIDTGIETTLLVIALVVYPPVMIIANHAQDLF